MVKSTKDIGLTASYPDVTVSFEEKSSPEYGLKWGRAIENDWWGKESRFYQDRFDELESNRAYAAGLNSTDNFKQSINETGDTSILALDYDNMTVAPRFVKVMIDHIMDLPEVRTVESIDSISVTEKEEYKRKLIGKLYNRELILEAREEFGEEFDEMEFIPDSMEDAEMHMEMTYKQSLEIVVEQVISLIFSINNYDNETKRRLIHSIIVDGFGVVKTTADRDRGITVENVDGKFFITSPSDHPDFNDQFYAAEIKKMSIYELKRLSNNEIPETEWKSISQKYTGAGVTYYGHSTETRTDFSSFIGKSVHDYDKAFVDVMHFRVKLPCKEVYKKKSIDFGVGKSFRKKGENYELPKYGKGKVVEDEFETVFEGYYILKSASICFGWGQSSNIAVDSQNFKAASLGYDVYMPDNIKGTNRSYIAAMKTPLNQMYLAHLKIQQMVSQAKPTGYKIDISAIDQIDMGHGNSMGYLDTIDIYDATGRLYYRSRNTDGEWNNPDPISALPNAIQNLPELMNVYNFYFEQLMNVTGLTPNMLGQIGNRQATATVESSIESSASAISDVAHAYASITRRVASNVVSMFMDIPKGHKIYNYYADAIGRSAMAVIESLGNRSLRSFGITIHIETDKQKRLLLEQNISLSLERMELRLEDAMAVRNVADKNVKLAEKYLVLRRKKYQKEKMQEMQAAQEMQSQSNQQAVAAATQAKQQEMMMELEIFKQREAIRLQGLQQEKMMDAQINSQQSTQDFYEELQLKGMDDEAKNKKDARQDYMSMAKIDYSDQKQKENIVLRSKLGGKQNESVPKPK